LYHNILCVHVYVFLLKSFCGGGGGDNNGGVKTS